MLFRSIRFCSFQFDCFSSAAFIFCSSITSCNWGHLSVLPNPVCTSTKMHQNASKVRKFVVKKLQILHKTLLSWSHACILRKRTSPLQRQFEDYTENNSHHHQKCMCKIVESGTPTMHYRLRGSMGFEKYKKWKKVDTCFSFNKPTKQDILHFLT